MTLQLCAAAVLGIAAGGVAAAPVLLQSNSVRVNVTDAGVFSSLRYDAAASGNFPANTDYVSPGIPFEGFEVRFRTSPTAGNTSYANSNSGGAMISGTTTNVSTPGNFAAQWSGGNSQFSLTHTFSFDGDDERVNIVSTLTAITDLFDLRLSRAVDPDPDSALPGGTADTNNQRGIPAQSVPTSDFVGSLGSLTGRPLGLFYSGPIAHNTGIVSYCCGVTNPDDYLAGGDLGNSSTGDHGIGIGFNFGSLLAGQSVSLAYAYVMGGSLGTIDIPGDPPPTGDVPLPSTLLLLGMGLVGLRGLRRARA